MGAGLRMKGNRKDRERGREETGWVGRERGQQARIEREI